MIENAMTGRERLLATVRGERVDRFPVWLKMANRTWQHSQPEPYRSMGGEELLRAAGCDLMLGNGCAVQSRNPHVESKTIREDQIQRTVWTTPDGDLVAEEQYDPGTESWHPTRFPINNAEELAAARWLYRGTEYVPKEDSLTEHSQRQKDLESRDVVTTAGVGPSPLMNMVEHQAGPVNTIYLMKDQPEVFREVTEFMHQDRLRYLKALLPSLKADTFWMSENTSTTLISPDMFAEFCMPHLTDYGRLIQNHNIIPVHHMCGTLNALLEMIDRLPAPVNEAFTTPPVGDATLAEGRTRMPSKTLIGGTNAALLIRDLETIVETISADLENCPERSQIFLTSAGVLPPPVTFEKAKKIVDALKNLPIA